MYIPMGTVVTLCMLLTVLFTSRLANRFAPSWLLRTVGVIAAAAGLWNVLWFAARNFGEFWGTMALGSGVVLLALGSTLILPATRLPDWLNKIRPVLVFVLLAFALYYAQTIYNL
ncbi:MAG: hypothetical protein ACI8VW_001472 [bacterium]|jgi:hypothetical protein